MKKFIKFLLGNALIKTLIITIGNSLITKFIQWLLPKMFQKFGHLSIYRELSIFLMEISVEDFFKDNDDEITKIVNNV